jgi:hypothetical protein
MLKDRDMIAIDKAWELLNKIWLNTGVDEQTAIKCALIAVDEILNEPDCSEAFWSDVKQELEKLKK